MKRLIVPGMTIVLVLGCAPSNDPEKGKGDPSVKAMIVTETDFDREVLQSKQPVLVDFWGEG